MPAIQTDTIPALTVCQPYASLLLLPHSHPDAKKIENRVWYLDYRGPLAIHAGKATNWLATYGKPLPKFMLFGYILGVVDVVECFRYVDIAAARVPSEFAWTRIHIHAEGPWCIVCTNPRPLAEPIPYRGAQKLWRVPRELVASVLDAEHAAR